MEKKSKKSIIIGITSLFIVMLLLLGLTYAYYRTRIIGNDSNQPSISVQSKKLEIVYSDGNATMNMTGKIEPGFVAEKEFSVENTGSETVAFSIKIDNVVNGFNKGVEKRGEYFDWKYYLYSGTEEKADNLITSGEITFETEQYLLESVSIDKDETLEYLLKVEYVNLTDIDQSADMGENFSLRVNIGDEINVVAEKEITDYTLSKGYFLQANYGYSNIGDAVACENPYMITDFIPCKQNTKYVVTENQTVATPDGSNTATRCILYDENYNYITMIYQESRPEAKVYTHMFTSYGASYFRIQFRTTDSDITIKEIGKNNNISLIYRDTNSSSQGLAASDDYIFIGYSASANENKNDYKIRKLDINTGEVLQTSATAFNHTNDIAYNENTNELVVTGLDGYSDETTDETDNSLFIIDADTLTLKETISLTDIVDSVCIESPGISAVTYDSNLNEYYVLTRLPERHIIILNENFEKKSSIHLYNEGDYTDYQAGGITTDGNYFYVSQFHNVANSSSSYNKEIYQNKIMIFDKSGNLVDAKSVSGSIHIEGIEYANGKFYMSYMGYLFRNPEIYSMKNFDDLVSFYHWE